MTAECKAEIKLDLSREGLGTFADEGMPMFWSHWKEISSYVDIPLNIDLARYIELEAADKLRIFTARMNGVLVGYAVFFVGFNMHYSDSFQAVQDIVYVSPEFRGLWLGLKLLRHCDRQLAAEGIQVAAHHVKIKHPALGVILKRLGYDAVETIYSRRLDR